MPFWHSPEWATQKSTRTGIVAIVFLPAIHLLFMLHRHAWRSAAVENSLIMAIENHKRAALYQVVHFHSYYITLRHANTPDVVGNVPGSYGVIWLCNAFNGYARYMSGHELRSEYLFPKCQKKTKKKILPSVWPVSTPVELTFERVKGSLGHATNFYSKTPSPIIKPQQRKKLRRSSYMGGSMTLPIIFAFTASRKPRSYSVDLKGDNQEDYNLRGFE